MNLKHSEFSIIFHRNITTQVMSSLAKLFCSIIDNPIPCAKPAWPLVLLSQLPTQDYLFLNMESQSSSPD